MTDERRPFEEHNINKYSGMYRPPIWVWLFKILKSRAFSVMLVAAFALAAIFALYLYAPKLIDSIKTKEPIAATKVQEPEPADGLDEIIAVIEPYADKAQKIRDIVKEEIKSILPRPTPLPSKDKTLIREIERLKAVVAMQKKEIQKIKARPPAPQKNKYQYLIDKYFQNPIGTLCVKYIYRGRRHGERVIQCWDDGFISSRKY